MSGSIREKPSRAGLVKATRQDQVFAEKGRFPDDFLGLSGRMSQ